jgi:hypothetical protein
MARVCKNTLLSIFGKKKLLFFFLKREVFWDLTENPNERRTLKKIEKFDTLN